MEIAGKNNLDVFTLSSNDRLLDRKTTKSLQHKWKRIKYPLRAMFHQRPFSLRLMAKLTYGNWENFCENIFQKHEYSTTPGFSGSAVVITRDGINKVGEWDLSQQGADYDLMTRTLQRWHQKGDIQPCMVVNGIFHHHYRRVSADTVYPPFEDKANLKPYEEKWKDNPDLLKETFAVAKNYTLPDK